MRSPISRPVAILIAAVVVLLGAPGLAGAANSPAQPKSAADTTADCGGAQLTKSTGGDWQCTFDDEFSGSSLDLTKWTVQTTAGSGFTAGPACVVDDPANESVSGGYLNLTVRTKVFTYCKSPSGSFWTNYTAASVSTFDKFAQTYGRFEIRAKFPESTLRGLQESIWLWPVNSVKYGPIWPESGEIDIAEAYSVFHDRAVPYVHYVPAAPDYNVSNNYCTFADPNAFHTFTAVWTPTTITISYDGNTCISDTWNPYGLTKPAPFDQPFMVAITQGLGVGYNAANPFYTKVPATTQVDYVRVWK
jgi:beta-glucanase (GH16 family)